MWFGDRTLARARARVLSVIPRRARELDETLAEFNRFRLKNRDLTNFLCEQPWKTGAKLTAANRRGASDQSLAHPI